MQEEDAQQGQAMVLLDQRGQENNRCSVAIDNLLGGEIAMRHLLTLGHRRRIAS
jgi:LacI family transcriptional regulator